ncbi:hypothetical protein FGO68_gene9452 [Halteria grandinella]|uniref:Uncharacterized protein n=1 Tax=Halteria grandinella TaxID=5974 RepID=A0A8J8P6Z1_HALGN|nr:hypothetical protein FGO68_gene9452 [Halteria grandinella]
MTWETSSPFRAVNVRLALYDYFIACRALFPGCRRCQKNSPSEIFYYVSKYFGSNFKQSSDVVSCGTCDEGMYLYPVSDVVYNGTEYYHEDYTTCVVECNEYDRNFVNNPELMRCEYLGIYCMYGNYTHGCIKPLPTFDGDNNMVLFNYDDYSAGGYLNLRHKDWVSITASSNPSYKFSGRIDNFAFSWLDREPSMPMCSAVVEAQDVYGQLYDYCVLCHQGYIFDTNTNLCIRQCPDNYYAEMYQFTDTAPTSEISLPDSGLQQSLKLIQYQAICSPLHQIRGGRPLPQEDRILGVHELQTRLHVLDQ